MGDWYLVVVILEPGWGCLFGVWDRIALHCMYREMGMTHRPARGNGNPSEGVGEWAPLSLSLSFGIWVRSCDEKKGVWVEFWIPRIIR